MRKESKMDREFDLDLAFSAMREALRCAAIVDPAAVKD